MKTLLFLLIPVLLLSQSIEYSDSVNNCRHKHEICTDSTQDETFPHLSFGAYYIPAAKLYRIHYYYDYGRLYLLGTEYDLSKMEAHLTYKFTKQVGIMLELGYTSNYSKERSEEHEVYTSDTYDDGYIQEDALKTFNISIYLKYYLLQSLKYKVNPYLILGVGKQFSNYVDDYKDLYDESTSQAIVEENYEDFMSKINSPYMFNMAFGVEYFFTKSLSAYSMLEFTYLKASAEYKYRYEYNSGSYHVRRYKEKYEQSYSTTEVGIGLNFYF